jgi:hypothetical protein
MTNSRELLPEEKLVGSDDPTGQTEAILEESKIRAAFPEKVERRTSDEATPPA